MALACQCFESARILFDAGVCDKVLGYLNEVETVINRRRKHGDLTSQAFAEYTAQMKAERPRKLVVLARKVIRSCLGTNIKRDIEKTPIKCAGLCAYERASYNPKLAGFLNQSWRTVTFPMLATYLF